MIEKVDVILDDEPYPDYGWVLRSAFQITGGSTALIRSSSWDGFTRIFGLASSPTFEGNETGIDVRGVTTTPVITGNSFCDNATDLTVPDGSTLTLDGNTICEVVASDAP